MANEAPPFLQPRLRLFLSVDLIGSTNLKQISSHAHAPGSATDQADLGDSWFRAIATFYSTIQREFSSQWTTISESELAGENHEFPELWKSNGDELIYVTEINSSWHCVVLICSWLRTLKRCRRQIIKSKFGNLDLKGTAWTAGFPIKNSEIAFRRTSDNRPVEDIGIPMIENFRLLQAWYGAMNSGGSQPIEATEIFRDFIGPSMDIGFRLCAKSDARKFCISPELAYILCAGASNGKCLNELHFFYDGSEIVKGVLGGEPYPIFWIDVQDDDNLAKIEDDLRNRKHLDRQKVSDFCLAFFERYPDYCHPPFIEGERNKAFSVRPNEYENRHRKLVDVWVKENKKMEIEKKALSGEEATTDRSDSKSIDSIALEEMLNNLQLN
jgi:hypothetical protein